MTKETVEQKEVKAGETWNFKPKRDKFIYMVKVIDVTATHITVLPCRKGCVESETYKLDEVVFANRVK